MKIALRILLITLTFIVLTSSTQIGGIVFLCSLIISKKWKATFRFKNTLVFITLYLLSTFLIIPFLAPLFGREKIKHTNLIAPTNYMTVVLNRNYVRPEMNLLLAKAANELQNTKIQIHYLDANFPFINKFPLLPHKSHDDGKKLDISLIYENEEGKITSQQKSISGYGVFEEPRKSEYNQIQKCLQKSYFQYDFPKYVTFGNIHKNLAFSAKGTKKLIKALLKQQKLGTLFIEPHLRQRLGLQDSRVRYHGCGAVRHDDHIHIQLR